MSIDHFSSLDRQRDIYTRGISGQKPSIPLNWQALQQTAQRAMSKRAWAYIAGGAGHAHTVSRNELGFGKWQIVPQMLRDVSVRDTSIALLGKRYASPFVLCPIGVLEMAHPQADLAVAKAAAALNIPYIFSNQASVPMETCAAAMGNAPRWFQLYWSKSDELSLSLVKRAEQCGCDALVITLDTTLLGWRTADLDLAYLPFLEGKGIAQYTSDPVFNQLLRQTDTNAAAPVAPLKPRLTWRTLQTMLGLLWRYPQGSFLKNLQSGEALRAVRQFINIYSRPSLTWENLSFLRQHTRLPILLKGILQPLDAQKALDYGMDGIVISNHGGRQVDGAVSTIEMLPDIAQTIAGRIPIIIDSGIRGGADAFKALALGATAVGIGRPYCYALAIAGEQGVSELLANYRADFELTMGLAGCKNIAEINSSLLRSTNLET
jgi:lactate 2-monooxygenase